MFKQIFNIGITKGSWIHIKTCFCLMYSQKIVGDAGIQADSTSLLCGTHIIKTKRPFRGPLR